MTRTVLVTLALLPLAAPAQAQQRRFELTPFIGWRFGGGLSNVNNPNAPSVQGLDVNNSWDYGLILDIAINRMVAVELLFDRQNATVAQDVPGARQDLFDTKIDYYQAGLQFQVPDRQLKKPQGYLSITMGATNFIPDGDASSELRYSFGGALGAKVFFNDRFGVNVYTRYVGTYFNSTTDLFCAESGQCFQLPANTILHQLNIAGGAIIAF
jgi:hypothetical protein